MDRATLNAAIAAALIIMGFGIVGYYMPVIMAKLGAVSPFAGAAAAVLFVLAFFGVFWLRARSRGDRGE